MEKLSKDFFSDGEVLFVGYSSRNNAFSKDVYQALTRGGIKVYPLNHRENAIFDIKVYKDLDELSAIPKCAYVLLNKDNAPKAVKQLADKGVKRILFQSKRNVEPGLLDECSKMGIETAVGCPMMIYGKGLHKIHAFFAGVR